MQVHRGLHHDGGCDNEYDYFQVIFYIHVYLLLLGRYVWNFLIKTAKGLPRQSFVFGP